MQTYALYTYFSKASDKVNRRILLRRLSRFGLTDEVVGFLASYLRYRKQYVSYKGFKLGLFKCPSGVPEGSNLGPLFFLIHINDVLGEPNSSKMLLCADDIKLFRPMQKMEDRVACNKN